MFHDEFVFKSKQSDNRNRLDDPNDESRTDGSGAHEAPGAAGGRTGWDFPAFGYSPDMDLSAANSDGAWGGSGGWGMMGGGGVDDGTTGSVLTSCFSAGSASTSYSMDIEFAGSWTVDLQEVFNAAPEFFSAIVLGDATRSATED